MQIILHNKLILSTTEKKRDFSAMKCLSYKHFNPVRQLASVFSIHFDSKENLSGEYKKALKRDLIANHYFIISKVVSLFPTAIIKNQC